MKLDEDYYFIFNFTFNERNDNLTILRNYVITFVVFFTIDIVWLGFVAKNLYTDHLGHLMRSKTNWTAAIIFYIAFIGGLMFFVINPALEKGSWTYALLAGGFFGLITYATYDMTNLATLKDWPLIITLVDITWGTVLNALTAMVSFFIINLFGK